VRSNSLSDADATATAKPTVAFSISFSIEPSTVANSATAAAEMRPFSL
jgi:hypothetical protein